MDITVTSLRAGLLALLSLPWLPAPKPAPKPAPAPLYMPRAVKQAYAKGTRSMDGKPGRNYWQNHGRYTIDVTALPPDRTIRGTETIVYTNNSPTPLPRLIMKLIVNIHRPGAPRDGGASADYLTSGTHIDAISVNGQRGTIADDPRFFTNRPIPLPKPLLPHDSVTLTLDWHYEISKEAGREGMLDSTTYYLAYFYPRIAVYDDYNGWDTMDFLDSQEFYNDFNDYDVTVHVPANFVVWGTGTLRNPTDVLQPEIARRFQASLTSDAVVRIATVDDFKAKRVTNASGTAPNAWHFTASDITDATFALSDHYDWDGASVVVDDAAKRRASVQSAYNDTAADFHHMVHFGQHALDWLSHNWPGIPYPYEKTTIVQGSADMEYPMMVNDGSNADTTFSRFVVEHEIAHTYMPFYMGINETRYAFMDEGWATTFEYLIGTADIGHAKEVEFYKQFRVNGWANDPSPAEDLPIITPEDVLRSAAWGNNAYGKASLGYLAMKDYLGDAQFKTALHAYMDRWHGKHPIPWDFFNTFNDVTGRNLDWFWNNWYFTNGYIDLAVKSVAKSGTGYVVTIDNIGGFAAPTDVIVSYADGSTETFHQTPAIWESNQARAVVKLATKKAVKSLTLDGGIWVDADPSNNSWAAK